MHWTSRIFPHEAESKTSTVKKKRLRIIFFQAETVTPSQASKFMCFTGHKVFLWSGILICLLDVRFQAWFYPPISRSYPYSHFVHSLFGWKLARRIFDIFVLDISIFWHFVSFGRAQPYDIYWHFTSKKYTRLQFSSLRHSHKCRCSELFWLKSADKIKSIGRV